MTQRRCCRTSQGSHYQTILNLSLVKDTETVAADGCLDYKANLNQQFGQGYRQTIAAVGQLTLPRSFETIIS